MGEEDQGESWHLSGKRQSLVVSTTDQMIKDIFMTRSNNSLFQLL